MAATRSTQLTILTAPGGKTFRICLEYGATSKLSLVAASIMQTDIPAPRSRTWLITGVSSGFGRAVAEAALAAGDRVVGTVRTEAARAAFAAIARDRAIAMILDVTDEAAVHATVAAAEKLTGGIDIL